MIGADTNILARAFLRDDFPQSQEAQQFMLETSEGNQLFISSYAILEFVWVLKVKNFTRQEIYEAVLVLINASGTVIGQRNIVANALDKYIKGKADFGDYMILEEGRENKSYAVKTFDKVFQRELT